MKYIKLRDLEISRIGLCAMGMSHGYTDSGTDEAESIRTLHRARELGVTFIDTAEIYRPYANEELLGRALKGRRDQVVLAIKFGMVAHGGAGQWNLDSSPANIRTGVEGSLRRLGTDHIDLYTSTGLTRARRSRTPSARWPSWWSRARSVRSGCRRPARTPSAAPAPSTR
jgi:aryl-alcohol dehydrogenase-like predicted oxidoreductase